ncbi:MAG: hypothetical protein ACOYJI_06470 [Anaerovoracaceae bacterium]
MAKSYELKTDPATGKKYVELTEEDGCKYIDNLPDFADEAAEKAYYAGLEKDGYLDIETAEKIRAEEDAQKGDAPR